MAHNPVSTKAAVDWPGPGLFPSEADPIELFQVPAGTAARIDAITFGVFQAIDSFLWLEIQDPSGNVLVSIPTVALDLD